MTNIDQSLRAVLPVNRRLRECLCRLPSWRFIAPAGCDAGRRSAALPGDLCARITEETAAVRHRKALDDDPHPIDAFRDRQG
jgi:hypothetical protein